MINKLRIHALKSIKNLDVECTNLNIFVGTNSSGKSTILQSLLMASQAIGSNGENAFDGEFVKLGTFDEVQSKLCKRENINIDIEFDNKEKATIEVSDKGIINSEIFDQPEYKLSHQNAIDIFQ